MFRWFEFLKPQGAYWESVEGLKSQMKKEGADESGIIKHAMHLSGTDPLFTCDFTLAISFAWEEIDAVMTDIKVYGEVL